MTTETQDNIEELTQRVFRVTSSILPDHSYIVSADEQTCTCTAYAVSRNRARTHNGDAKGDCKHLRAVLEFEQYRRPIHWRAEDHA